MYKMFVCGFSAAILTYMMVSSLSGRYLPTRAAIHKSKIYPLEKILSVGALRNRIEIKQPFHDY
jgi:hypothetical protein